MSSGFADTRVRKPRISIAEPSCPTWASIATLNDQDRVTVPASPPQQQQASAPAFATILQDEGLQHWSLGLSADGRQLRITSLNAKAADAGLDYELWIVPADSAPLSLGTIQPSQSVRTVQLTAEQMAALQSQQLLAVSLEPAGGSTTGVPTGPVLYTGVLVPI